MFKKFQQEVLGHYRELQANHLLPGGLDPVTRNSLRTYARQVLTERYDPKDDEVIRRFFDPENRYNDHEERVAHFELDGFRSLVNFMEGKTRNPDERVVQILAWLIDFKPRPYPEWKRFQQSAFTSRPDADAQPPGRLPEGGNDRIAPVAQRENASRANKRLPWYLAGAAFVTVFAGYFVINGRGCWEKQCMYWLNDRYVAVCCGAQPPGATAVAINSYELRNFRKITRPDTLSTQHANKVWYSKIDNHVEFFTAPASHHPVHFDRTVKPATAYIIETYAGHGTARDPQ